MALGDKLPIVMGREKAVPSGVATLDETGILAEAQRPSASEILTVDGESVEEALKSAGLPTGGLEGQALVKAGAGSDSLTKWGPWPSNQNLLINSDFRKPVNRNGKSEYTGAGHTIDRWHLGSNTLSLLTDCIQMSGTFKQVLQPKDIQVGKQYTFSVLVKEITGTALFAVYDGQQKSLFEGLNVLTFTATSNTYQGIYAAVNITQSVKIKAVKLELGDQQTLAHQDADGNWVLNDPPNYDLQYALCSQYSPITGEFVGSQHSNPNLLDNAYWANKDCIINQRGKDEYVLTSQGYTIDRWLTHLNETNYTVTNHTITCSNNMWSGLMQRIPSYVIKPLIGRYVTYSVLVEESDIPVRIRVTFKHDGANTIENTFPVINNKNLISVTGIVPETIEDDAITIQILTSGIAGYIKPIAFKLELGPVQTLAHKEGDIWVLNDPPPDPALELAKCQRYQQAFTPGQIIGLVYQGEFNETKLFMPLPAPIRVPPTLNNAVLILLAVNETFSALTLTKVSGYPGCTILEFRLATNYNIQGAKPLYVRYDSDVPLILDANL